MARIVKLERLRRRTWDGFEFGSSYEDIGELLIELLLPGPSRATLRLQQR